MSCEHVCVHESEEGQWRLSGVLFFHFQPYSFETGSFIEPGVRLVNRRPGHPPLPFPMVLGLAVVHNHDQFLSGC